MVALVQLDGDFLHRLDLVEGQRFVGRGRCSFWLVDLTECINRIGKGQSVVDVVHPVRFVIANRVEQMFNLHFSFCLHV